MLKVNNGYVDINKIVSIYTINDLNNSIIVKTLVGDTYIINNSTLEEVKQKIEETKQNKILNLIKGVLND
jgi:hypothetical protein